MEELGLVQAQKDVNQQNSLRPDYLEKMADYYFTKKKNEFLKRIEEFEKNNSARNLDESVKENILQRLSEYLKYCKDNNLPIIGYISDYMFEINEKNPSIITVIKEGYTANWEEKVESILTVNGDDVSCEYEEAVSANVYCKDDIAQGATRMTKIECVIDNKEVNEYIKFDHCPGHEDMSPELLSKTVQNISNELGYEVIESNLIAKYDVQSIISINDVINKKHGEISVIEDDSRRLGEKESIDKETLINNSIEFKKQALLVCSRVAEAYQKMVEMQKNNYIIH